MKKITKQTSIWQTRDGETYRDKTLAKLNEQAYDIVEEIKAAHPSYLAGFTTKSYRQFLFEVLKRYKLTLRTTKLKSALGNIQRFTHQIQALAK